MNRTAAWLLVLLLLGPAAACDGDGGSDGDGDSSGADAAPTADAAGPTIPSTPAGMQLAWLLGALNGAPVSAADVQAHFAPSFLAQVPPAQIQGVLSQLSTLGAWTLVDFEGAPEPTHLVAVTTRGDGQYWRIVIDTSSAAADRINGLFLVAAGDLDPALASFDLIDDAILALAPGVHLLAARVDQGGCTPLHELAPQASLAMGSVFKLWVLVALAERLAAGTLAWTDTIAIQDAYKSLPSGDLQDQPVGTLLPVQTYADKMISISDNTATDHLLFTLGRDAVEATLVTTGHHAPAQNRPFLGTRELFILKLMLSPAEQAAYIAASEADRRLLLTQYGASRDPRLFNGVWGAPRHIDTLEWFATPADMCQVMHSLKTFGEQPATSGVLQVLALNPGLFDVRSDFSYIGFKGGSEPGVLELAWLVRRASDDEWRFLALGFNDPTKDVPTERILYIAGAARALLAR